ncbi:hypothetical protein Poli38472_004863 [Pythium oligandrum]|uniref:Glutathione S-transferase n=1 Tax=Pythium oligandrum TaxID=41045 RepID=A0A8K1CB39_PYTOL|nr:hypothetical protein Poli38472_004863 [Pythium oligandrum]|eukprot:TMW59794.1 hypothetical protein Poli38472_004863 [Pythium oligandrum]
MSFPTIKLIYFNGAARAESIRLAFYIGNVPFEDVRLSFQEFGALKETFPYGQLPVLEVDGEVIAQSEALLRYAGRLSGLYPVNDPVAALKIDELLGSTDELKSKMIPSIHEQDPDKKKALREELANAVIPRFLGFVDRRLTLLKKHAVFQRDALFIHELLINSFVSWMKSGVLDHIPVTVCDGYTAVEELVTKVTNHPKVNEFYATSQNVAPRLKLTYLDGPGRAEPTRLAFLIGGIEFEDERIPEYGDIAKRGSTLPFGQVPVLSIDGEVHAQSHQILRYAGIRAGLYPSTNFKKALRVDEVLRLVDDYFNTIALTYAMEPEAQHSARKLIAKETLPKMFSELDKRIAGWGGQYAVGDELTVADLLIYCWVLGLKSGYLLAIPTTIADGYLHIGRIFDQVSNHPTVQEWNQKTAPLDGFRKWSSPSRILF